MNLCRDSADDARHDVNELCVVRSAEVVQLADSLSYRLGSLTWYSVVVRDVYIMGAEARNEFVNAGL